MIIPGPRPGSVGGARPALGAQRRSPDIRRSSAAPISAGVAPVHPPARSRPPPRPARRSRCGRVARPAAFPARRPRSAPHVARTSSSPYSRRSRAHLGPSTEGASRRTIRCTAGSRQASRNAPHPAAVLPRVLCCERRLAGPACQLLLDLLADGPEQLLLVAEVVVQRTRVTPARARSPPCPHRRIRASQTAAAPRRPASCGSPRSAAPVYLCEA